VFYRSILPELKAQGKTVLVISHDDRYFDLADRVLSLENGQLTVQRRELSGMSVNDDVNQVLSTQGLQ
jgi:ABC-type siderophore export system fused ATPase/permease subunit